MSFHTTQRCRTLKTEVEDMKTKQATGPNPLKFDDVDDDVLQNSVYSMFMWDWSEPWTPSKADGTQTLEMTDLT